MNLQPTPTENRVSIPGDLTRSDIPRDVGSIVALAVELGRQRREAVTYEIIEVRGPCVLVKAPHRSPMGALLREAGFRPVVSNYPLPPYEGWQWP